MSDSAVFRQEQEHAGEEWTGDLFGGEELRAIRLSQDFAGIVEDLEERPPTWWERLESKMDAILEILRQGKGPS